MMKEHENYMQLLGVLTISLFSPEGRFLDQVKKIRKFISELIVEAVKQKDDIAIKRLNEFNQLFDYLINAETLIIDLEKLKKTIKTGNFKQEEGAELLLDTIIWHEEFKNIMNEIRKLKSYNMFEEFLTDLEKSYKLLSEDSKEVLEIIDKTIADLKN